MVNRWLYWLNYAILGLIVLLCGSMTYIWVSHSDEILVVDPKAKQNGLPKGAFELSSEAYEGIAGTFLALESAPPSLQIPDLKSQLSYAGRNTRPDADPEKTILHFTLNGQKKATIPEERIYLVFDKSSRPPRYNFSPNNEKTSLSFDCSIQNNDVIVRVSMEDEKGEKITEPAAHAQFHVPEKDVARLPLEGWEVGTWRVDGTLLARQRARWFGHDRFLEKHGGKRYEHITNKQRIDFGENEDIYYVFVQNGDCLIWENDQWRVAELGPDSLKSPILVVKKIDDRIMSFEIWDTEGKSKIPLNLLKSNEPWVANNTQMIQQAFKFVGARTRTQCLFEINKERMVISPSDWLLMTPKGWKKLEKEEDIDKFVQRKTTGMLFVFEGWVKKDDHQVMQGTLFNPTRSESQTVELIAQQVSANKASVKNAKEADEDKGDAEELIEKMISSLSQGKEEAKKNPPSKPTLKTPPLSQKNQRAKK